MHHTPTSYPPPNPCTLRPHPCLRTSLRHLRRNRRHRRRPVPPPGCAAPSAAALWPRTPPACQRSTPREAGGAAAGAAGCGRGGCGGCPGGRRHGPKAGGFGPEPQQTHTMQWISTVQHQVVNSIISRDQSLNPTRGCCPLPPPAHIGPQTGGQRTGLSAGLPWPPWWGT